MEKEIQINEETISFTEHELERIAMLRSNKNLQDAVTYKPGWKDNSEFKVKDLVTINYNGVTTIGNINKVLGNYRYNISTPYGIVKNVERYNIRGRAVKDLSNIEVPEALAKMTTQKLVKLLRCSQGVWEVTDMGVTYHKDEIKAALQGRPNVENSKVKKKLFKK